MTLFVCWVVFPLLLAALSLGCGLAVARSSRTNIQPPLLVPVGFAGAVVIGSFATLTAQTARLTLPTLLAVAAAGLASALPMRPRVDLWGTAAAVAVFAVFAAPIVLSGEATFAGYIKLDDTATFLAIVDRALEHGRSIDGLPASSYEATLAFNLHFYPLGSLLPLGAAAALTGQDAAWLYQPYLAFLAALLALILYELGASVVASRPLRAAAAVLASQAALLYGYALWGGVKELAAAPLVALVVALVGSVAASTARPLALLPPGLAAAALVAVLSIGAVPWLVPPAVVAAIVVLRRRDRRRPLVVAVLGLALVLPSIAVLRTVLGEGVLGSLRDASELGNLIAPLSPLQLLGIWPTGDFRFRPEDLTATYALAAVVAAMALAGLATALARRAWQVAVYGASALGASLAYGVAGSPWIEAKAFAIGSPALIFMAVLGCAALIGRGRRVEGIVALAAIAAGVFWSNGLAYREVNLAPREQLAELEAIGKQFAGAGPALMTEYQPYGVRHFLRALDAEGASELRRRPVALKNGSMLPKGGFADLSAFRPDDILVYRTLVLRRSPVESRPPASYRLAWSGRSYEVWQRPEALATAGAPVPCRHPPKLYPVATGGAPIPLSVPKSGRYELWVGGSFRGKLTAAVDGRPVGSAQHRLNYEGQYVSLGDVMLTAGAHTLTLNEFSARLQPGSGGGRPPLGPVAVSPLGRCGSPPA